MARTVATKTAMLTTNKTQGIRVVAKPVDGVALLSDRLFFLPHDVIYFNSTYSGNARW